MKEIKTIFYLLVSVSLLSFLNSCQNLEIIEPENELEQMVSEAKYFFEKEVVINSSISNARNSDRARTRKNLRKELQWDKAHIKELSFATALIIPVEYDEELYIPKGNSFLSINQLTYIIIYKGDNGKFNIETVTTVPDEQYLTSSDVSQPFSGLVLVENWDGDFIKGFIYRAGTVEDIELIEEDGSSSSSRVNGRGTLPYCIVTEYYWCTDVTVEGNTYTSCMLEYTITTCYGGGGGISDQWADYSPGGDVGGGNSGDGDDMPNIGDNYSGDGDLYDNDYETIECAENLKHVPKIITLKNGSEVDVTFGITQSDGLYADNPIAESLLNAIIFALNEASQQISINHIHISATSNGTHGTYSNHYKNRAVDISRVNNSPIISIQDSDLVRILQESFDNYSDIRENFGPAFHHKLGQNYNVGGHSDHLHISTNNCK